MTNGPILAFINCHYIKSLSVSVFLIRTKFSLTKNLYNNFLTNVLVGVSGLEPETFSMSMKRSTS